MTAFLILTLLSAAPVVAQYYNYTVPRDDRGYPAAASAGTKALFAGGDTREVDVYDLTTDSWSSSLSLAIATYYKAATALGSTAFIGFGTTGTGNSAIVNIYQASTGVWSSITLSHPRLQLG